MLVPVLDIGTYVAIMMDESTHDDWTTAGYVALGNAGLKLVGLLFYFVLKTKIDLTWLEVVGSAALGYFTFAAESSESLDYAAIVGYTASGWGVVFGIIRAMRQMKAKKMMKDGGAGGDGGDGGSGSAPLCPYGGYYGYYGYYYYCY